MASDFRRYTARHVVVQLEGIHALEGTLARATQTALTLTDASLIEGGRVGEMEGEVAVPIARVLWLQVV